MKIGDKVKDFKLKDHNDQLFSTADYQGKRLLLSFHPLAWTSICAKQMQVLDQNHVKFESLRTVPVGLSIDHQPCKQEWARSLSMKQLRLLCDFWPHGDLAKTLGVFRDAEGFSERANIILDENRNIVFFKVYPIKLLPDTEEIFEFLKKTI